MDRRERIWQALLALLPVPNSDMKDAEVVTDAFLAAHPEEETRCEARKLHKLEADTTRLEEQLANELYDRRVLEEHIKELEAQLAAAQNQPQPAASEWNDPNKEQPEPHRWVIEDEHGTPCFRWSTSGPSLRPWKYYIPPREGD